MRYGTAMDRFSDITPVEIAGAASLLSDVARASILCALLDGRARTAGELAFAAGVTPQTASSHLGRLVDAGWITVVPQGRHRYYGLAGEDWAEALEAMMAVHLPQLSRHAPAAPEVTPLSRARLCYRHLAGRLGVAWAETLQRRDYLHQEGLHLRLSRTGGEALRKSGLLGADDDLERLEAKPCLDWTERRQHLAGPLANRLTQRMLEQRWLLRSREARVLLPTADGERQLRRLGVSWQQ